MESNYRTTKLYADLFEVLHILTGEVLPQASQIKSIGDDIRLTESAEIFARELERHLTENQITVTPSVPKKRK